MPRTDVELIRAPQTPRDRAIKQFATGFNLAIGMAIGVVYVQLFGWIVALIVAAVVMVLAWGWLAVGVWRDHGETSDLVLIGHDASGDRHVAWSTEASRHQAAPQCGCNPDWTGEEWTHWSFDA